METKEAQTVARDAASPAAPKDRADLKTPGPVQEGPKKRKKDEITLRVPNPLLVHQVTPPPEPSDLPQIDLSSPHSSPTAKLKVSSLVWNEYNAMPLTPPPVLSGHAQNSAVPFDSEKQLKKRRGITLALVAAIISAGVIAGALIPREKAGPLSAPAPKPEAVGPAPSAPEKVQDVEKFRAAAAVVPAPSPLAKRHVSVVVEPAEATLVLDGAVVGGHTIAVELVQDKKSHVVQASAHGYLPFRRTFTLEDDLNLHVSLKRFAAPVVTSHPKARPSEPVAKVAPVAKLPESEPNVRPTVEPAEDFGMDLTRPAVRRQIKKMDEKDPYSP